MKLDKLLIVGDFQYDIYEKSFYDAFKKKGYDVEKFAYQNYINYLSNKPLKNINRKIQNKFAWGPQINQLNDDLIQLAKNYKPDLIFIYRGRHIKAKTIATLKQFLNNTLIFAYNNDDPFSADYPSYYWRHYLKSIKICDYIFCYRPKNISDLHSQQIFNCSILKPYFIASNNFETNTDFNSRKHDVVFAGHFEDDGRDETIKHLVDNKINIALFGTGWNESKYAEFFNKKLGPIRRLNPEEYNKVLNNSKISLVFLSKRNNDQYTRRCFEIPATGCVMLSERTNELMKLYEENREILFFDSKEELVEKATFFIANCHLLQMLAKQAKERLFRDKHEVSDRVEELIAVYHQIKAN